MARSGHIETVCYLSAFGQQRTYILAWLRPHRSWMAQSRHRPSSPTGSNLYSRARTLLLSHRVVGTGPAHRNDL